eukprot:7376746-Prymnesium_polylepis.2
MQTQTGNRTKAQYFSRDAWTGPPHFLTASVAQTSARSWPSAPARVAPHHGHVLLHRAPPRIRVHRLRLHVWSELHRLGGQAPPRADIVSVPQAVPQPDLWPALLADAAARGGGVLLAAQPATAALLPRSDGRRLRALLHALAAAHPQPAGAGVAPILGVRDDADRASLVHPRVVRRPGDHHRREPASLLAGAVRWRHLQAEDLPHVYDPSAGALQALCHLQQVRLQV